MSHPSPEELQGAAAEALDAVAGQRLKPRQRRDLPAQAMPQQAPTERVRNFHEVALGYTPEQARLEAMRCLNCASAPCVAGCPVRIDIPGFVRAIAEDDLRGAIEIIKRNSLLPAICGRVCPQETQCQAPCTVGKALKDVDKAVSIGRLERYVADWERQQGTEIPAVAAKTGKKVAVVGSGPASLVVAADVRRQGHAVTILEAFHKPGGVMIYGIPEFRLPKAIVQEEIDTLTAMGVEIRTNFVVGRTCKLSDLIEKDGFDAVFVGTGAGLPIFLGLEGENLIGVFSANEYLTRVNLMQAWREEAHTPVMRSRRVAVLGGGNVAMDAARTAVRLGAEEVHVVYRRAEEQMPARLEEAENAKEEGVIFDLLQNAKRILGDEHGRVTGMECLRYELGEPDDSGRRRPVAIAGSEFVMPCDTVIVAIGNNSNPLIEQTTSGLDTNQWGNIVADEEGRTSLDRVWAGGDIVLGAATVILAMGQGRTAAAAINEFLARE